MAFPLLTSEEQADLVARVRAGDPAAETRVAELFSPAIRAMARARSRGAADPQDVCQDALIAVITALRRGQLRDVERLAAFVAGVARNVIHAEFRSRSQGGEPLAELHEPVADLRDEITRRDRRRLLRDALAELTASDRQILVLTLVHGLKSGEVATRLGLESQVVRARKSRALRRLAERVRNG